MEMAPPGPSAGPARPPSASIADEDDEEEENEDFAPGNDADYFVEEDAEGRFFGGGLTDQQKRILEIMNSGDPDENDDEKVRDAFRHEQRIREWAGESRTAPALDHGWISAQACKVSFVSAAAMCQLALENLDIYHVGMPCDRVLSA